VDRIKENYLIINRKDWCSNFAAGDTSVGSAKGEKRGAVIFSENARTG
jgi:hypothetical protein